MFHNDIGPHLLIGASLISHNQLILNRLLRGWILFPVVNGRETVYTFNRSPEHHRVTQRRIGQSITHTHTNTSRQFRETGAYFLDCCRKPEYQKMLILYLKEIETISEDLLK